MVHVRRMLAALAALGVAGAIFAIAAVLYKDQSPPVREARTGVLYIRTYDDKKNCGIAGPGGKVAGHPTPCRPMPPK